jgi:ubiquinone/menaquinone biosynthesis C-methylase UbiE
MEKMFYWKEFIDEINAEVKDGFTVLDAGAGDGHWKNHFKKEISYIAMDFGVGDHKVDYSSNDIIGDLKNIPLDDESVDMIICIQVLEHVPEPWKVVKEFNRVLKTNGYLFMSLPHSVPIHQEPYDFYRYTKYGVDFLYKENGFHIEFIKPQKGNASKIANDLRMSGNFLIQSGHKGYGMAYKLFARMVELWLKPSEARLNLYNDTTGYFIKGKKL